jgi:hypothetical protein
MALVVWLIYGATDAAGDSAAGILREDRTGKRASVL